MRCARVLVAGLVLVGGLFAAPSIVRADDEVPAAPAEWKPDDPDLERDLALLQGRWNRTGRNTAGEVTSRQEKVIEGNRETVTYFDGEGKVQSKHAVKFRLEKHGPVRIFSVYERTNYAGDQAVTSAADFSFIYRVDEKLLLDAPGLFATRRTYQATPVVYQWQRVETNGRLVPSQPR